MTATPKPDVKIDNGLFINGVQATTLANRPTVAALLAEAPTMDLPADHPYWEVPDELRRGMHWDRDLERFTARGEIARVLRDEHGWTCPLHGQARLVDASTQYDRYPYEVRPPERPKVTQVPAREVAKRLIDGERVSVVDEGEVTGWDRRTALEVRLWLWFGTEVQTYSWDSTVPVIEDGAS